MCACSTWSGSIRLSVRWSASRGRFAGGVGLAAGGGHGFILVQLHHPGHGPLTVYMLELLHLKTEVTQIPTITQLQKKMDFTIHASEYFI